MYFILHGGLEKDAIKDVQFCWQTSFKVAALQKTIFNCCVKIANPSKHRSDSILIKPDVIS